MIPDDENKILGEAGMIPGPQEEEKDFIKRIHFLKERAPTLFKERKYEILVCDFHDLGATPKWIPLIYSNQRLLPWQGAVSWTITTPNTPPFPLVQLRKGFRKGHFFFNDRDEVLRHETLHAIRLTFNEPRFEEIFAYFHSSKKWKRFLGPLFRKESQVSVFLSLVLFSFAAQISVYFFSYSPLFLYVHIICFLPLINLFFYFIALIKDRKILLRAFSTLQLLFPKHKNPFAIALRLKDSEIQMFATKPIKTLLHYIKEQTPSSLRWRQILAQFS